MPVIEYAEVLRDVETGRSHLLLGNGFSIACDPVFAYPSLYERAVAKGLSARCQAVFARLGTNNFEGVMRLLGDSDWVGRTYGIIAGAGSPMLDDLEIVKHVLVDTIADSHLRDTGSVSEDKKRAAATFFRPYYNIITTNYDLLAYWVILSDGAKPKYWDCFGDDPEEPEAPHVVFSFHLGDHPGLLYLHGGLHLFVNAGHVTKHCWNRSREPLTTLIRRGLDEGQYPLFVAEGTPDKKLEQIYANSYLSYALDKFSRMQGRLVVFGSSLSATDAHLRNAIASMKKLETLYISVHDPLNTVEADQASVAIQERRRELKHKDLKIRYFTAPSANVWGP